MLIFFSIHKKPCSHNFNLPLLGKIRKNDKILGMSEENDNTEDKAFEDSVYILDSYGLIYRAYYALLSHPLTNRNKENISAVVIFFRNLKALIDAHKPKYLIAAFDSRTPTFRHEMYKEYKATRQKTPEDLHAQVPWIESALKEFGITVLRKDGYEADDIIATVAKKCKAENRTCRILSADKDLLQLVNETCQAMQPDKANGGWEINRTEDVIEKWGVGPEKILDYLSLTGDSADNVPGVKGVGDKTALKLISEYGSLDGIYAHAEEIKGALGNKIRADKDNAYFSRELITLKDDVEIPLNFEDFSTSNLDYFRCAEKLMSFGAAAVAKSFASVCGKKIEEPKEVKESESQPGLFDSPDNNSAPVQAAEVSKSNMTCRKYSSCTKEEELAKIVDDILASQEKTVAFDTETDGLDSLSANLVGFSLCSKSGEAVYVPVILPGGMFAENTIGKEKCIALLSRLFECKDVTLVMHNGKFDMHVLEANGYKEGFSCRIADTMVAAWLLDSDATGKSPYSLEYLGETKLGLKGINFSEIVPKGKTFADIELNEAYIYGSEDADFTFQLWQKFEKELRNQNLTDLFFNMEMKILPILCAMETRGIHLDKESLRTYSVDLKQQIEAIEKEVYELAGHDFNISSTKQLQTVLFEEQGLTPTKKTKTGYSTDTAVLEELCERTTNPVPRKILEYRSLTKLLGTYVETLPEMTDSSSRIHTNFMQTGTSTGRLSSREPNLQNIPVKDENGRKIRSAFTAQNGTVLISADYSQIELVVLAHLSKDKNLSSAFINGIDVHRSTAALVYSVKPEEVTPEMRRFAKTINFGVMYGMSAFGLAKELGISRTQAKEFIDQYFITYSDVKKFISDTIAGAQVTGISQTITGRKRMIRGINSKNKLEQQGAQRIAINTPIQGSAADIVKKAMTDVNDAIENSDLKGKLRMLLQVHDELIFECPDDSQTVEKAVNLIREKMENAYKLNVPLRVSIETGSNWGQFH